MKIRTDFVTNSSSSSFIIAYRADNPYSTEEKDKYPLLRVYENIIKFIFDYTGAGYCADDTADAKFIKSVDELEEYIIEEYGWSENSKYYDCPPTLENIMTEKPWARSEYDSMLPYLSSGYEIAVKRVSYDDDILRDLIDAISDGNDSFIVISAEDD